MFQLHDLSLSALLSSPSMGEHIDLVDAADERTALYMACMEAALAVRRVEADPQYQYESKRHISLVLPVTHPSDLCCAFAVKSETPLSLEANSPSLKLRHTLDSLQKCLVALTAWGASVDRADRHGLTIVQRLAVGLHSSVLALVLEYGGDATARLGGEGLPSIDQVEPGSPTSKSEDQEIGTMIGRLIDRCEPQSHCNLIGRVSRLTSSLIKAAIE